MYVKIQTIFFQTIYFKQQYSELGGKLKLLSYKLGKQQADSAIYRIGNPDSGEIEGKLEKILQGFENFYRTLYCQPQIDNLQNKVFLAFLNDLLQMNKNKNLKAEKTKGELHSATSQQKTNKSPSTDGFTSK